jgi:hypothetical protein
MKWIAVLVLSALCIWSCSDNSSSDQAIPDYHITVGDSVITIPALAVTFANEHFSLDAYLLREYQVARDPALHQQGPAFSGTLNDWKALDWSVRQTFLMVPYSYDVRISDDAQYFYWIGTFFEQFGYGWSDTFDPEADLMNPAVHIWLHPADTTLIPDNASTVGFDGESHQVEQYRNMWIFE